MKRAIDDLFVFERTRPHWGGVERGLPIIDSFAPVVRSIDVRAAGSREP